MEWQEYIILRPYSLLFILHTYDISSSHLPKTPSIPTHTHAYTHIHILVCIVVLRRAVDTAFAEGRAEGVRQSQRQQPMTGSTVSGENTVCYISVLVLIYTCV